MIIDSHIHFITPKIIANVSKKPDLMAKIHTRLDNIEARISLHALEKELKEAGVTACLSLPTAPANNVKKTNTAYYEMTKETDMLYCAGTLHPDYPNIKKELARLQSISVRAIKFCTFSQWFDLRAPKTRSMFDQIRDFNVNQGAGFFVILDTFYMSDKYFGTPDEFMTLPERFGDLVATYPEINFIAAHMGALTGPVDEVCKYLPPRENFFMDTANAAHTLSMDEFVRLLKIYGPKHILFGTDWPWFYHKEEIGLINERLDAANFSDQEKNRVFCANIAELLKIKSL